MTEPAIPAHLRKPRTCPVTTPPGYIPPFPAYCARFPQQMNNLVMAVIGAQYLVRAPENIHRDVSTLKCFVTDAKESLRPSFWEFVSVTDKKGAFNIAVLAYWADGEVFARWGRDSGFKDWWENPDREKDDHGWFQEVLKPSLDRFETVFSNKEHPEGAANMQEEISGEILEHAYWGSMRDRLAAAQNDVLKAGQIQLPEEEYKSDGGKRFRVPGQKNLCIIRSGQDWSDTLPAERKLYLETMHPVLIQGMNFLRDSGREIGCYSMNLWDIVDPVTLEANHDRTFGFGFFDDLASLEGWSKSHQTHKDIFGGFLMYAHRLENVLSLRLFHEVYVLEEEEQMFEYVGCHGETGMLNVFRAGRD